MDSLNTYSEHADQPLGQHANILPLDVPPSQVLDSHMFEQQDTNLAPFPHEQHGLQLDQVLQLYNEQVQVSLQLEVSLRNADLLNLLTMAELIQKREEIGSMFAELQRTQEDLETARQLAVIVFETNESLIRRLPPVQQETNSHVSSNQLDAPGSGDETSSAERIAAKTARIDLVCKVCNSDVACMLLLPCKHLCACKPCEVRLTACPVCDAVKGNAIDAHFAEK
ncbi:unnamed protein product [Urochloa decumbens]|uniref:RING-type domain-containing protein n=1 Tax=Urochloa decumbens TaxID=240449 RepID=A0ABC9GBB0_9POAL